MALNFPDSPVLDELYSVNGTVWQWDGTKWIISTAQGLSRFTFTAAQNDTVFDVAYGTGKVQVYVNGLLMTLTDDYTLSNGTTLTFTSGLNANDVVEVIVFSAFDVANVYTVAEIDTLISGYEPADATISKTGTTQNFTAPQRSADTVDNDGSFNLSVAQNFTCTPTGNITLTFTNIPDGQSGTIVLTNGSNYTISAASTTYVNGATLTTISASGTYVLGYYSNGTNVYITSSQAVTSAGA